MADKDVMTAAAEAAAKELVKAAYGDLLQPAAREVGAELGEFVRAVMVAGRGFGYLIRERYEPFVLQAIGTIPRDRVALPPPPVLGKILEGITYEPDDTPLHLIFQRLLAASMDKERVRLVHPSFPVFLGHLCSDEVCILQRLHQGDITGDWSPPAFIGPTISPPINNYDVDLRVREAFDLYYLNLASLSLMIYTDEQELVEDEYTFKSRQCLTLQGMGRHLMAACSPPA